MKWDKPTNYVMPDSPVEQRRKELPRGDCKWAAYDHVYANISKACGKMGLDKHAHLSGLHIEAMAVLGSGHEETMKAMQMRLRDEGWI